MSRTETPRVLVFYDEPPICRSVEKILAKVDVLTRSALNGYAALTLMETESFDVVITDLKMSSMGGWKSCAESRRQTPTPWWS